MSEGDTPQRTGHTEDITTVDASGAAIGSFAAMGFTEQVVEDDGLHRLGRARA